ncbi:MAG TPA: hypothetical protein VE967_06730 [Gemmatimonadaceae bacterium]|nr:hypothetical protein [Gemmatimonadaceae bacterium]
MKRLAFLALAVAAQAAAAQTPPQISIGRPLPGRNPPTLPLHQQVRPVGQIAQPQRHVTYIPAPYLYNPYAFTPPSQPNVNVTVNNVLDTPPSVSLNYYLPAGSQFVGGGNDLRLWSPESESQARPASSATFSDLDPDRAHNAAADADDVKSLEAIVGALYDVLSGPRGTPRNWDRFRALFSDGAHLIATRSEGDGPARPTVMTPDEYASVAAAVLERGVFEKEVSRSVQQFGSIAHVFSTYECRRTSSELKPYQRGINSIQLMNDGTRWWIMSVSWDAETAQNPIPAKYLPAPPAVKKPG